MLFFVEHPTHHDNEASEAHHRGHTNAAHAEYIGLKMVEGRTRTCHQAEAKNHQHRAYSYNKEIGLIENGITSFFHTSYK